MTSSPTFPAASIAELYRRLGNAILEPDPQARCALAYPENLERHSVASEFACIVRLHAFTHIEFNAFDIGLQRRTGR